MSETILGSDLGSWLVITQVEACALIKGPLSIFRVSPLAHICRWFQINLATAISR